MMFSSFMLKLEPANIIKAFLDNGQNRIWRLDWFGEVDLNVQVPSEPTIEVVLVPLDKPLIDPQTINKKKSYDYGSRRVVRVGVGLLPCLQIGSLWYGGKKLDTPSYETLVLDQLLITPQTSRITDAGRDPNLFPRIFFPSIANCSKTKFLVVDLDPEKHDVRQGQKLLIPCVEISRFYYATSTPLARSIIWGDLESHNGGIYNPHRTRPPGPDGIGFVQLRQRVRNPQRRIAARIAFDPIAKRNARNIHDSILRNVFDEGCAVLEARPPFEGFTDLKVEGKWIMSADDIWHFWVYRIRLCSAPFPYEQLCFARDNEEGAKGKSDSGYPVAYPGSIKSPVRPPDPPPADRLVINDSEPSLNYEVTDVELDVDCFPDLKNKKKEEHFKDAEIYTRAGNFRSNDAEAVNTFSTGAGESSENAVASFSLSSKDAVQGSEGGGRKGRVPAGFAEFNAILSDLAKLGNITTSIVHLDSFDENQAVKSCTYFPTTIDGKISKWSYIDYDKQQRRQAMVAHITYQDTHFYIADIEVKEDDKHDRYSMLLVNDKKLLEVGEGRLRAVLYFAAENRGRWTRDWQLKDLVKERFKHDCDNTANYALRFFNAMRAYLEKLSGTSSEIVPNNPPASTPIFIPADEIADEIAEDIRDQQEVS